MKQLGDLGKTLTDALALVENFQRELENLQGERDSLQAKVTELLSKISDMRKEKESLQAEVAELLGENSALRAENQKIYLEMNNMRTAKEDLRAANETFAKNLNQLVIKLNETHEKTMEQINQLADNGFQQIVVDYVEKVRGTNIVTVADEDDAVEPKYSTEIIVEDTAAAVDVPDSRRPKMQYADFYAETNIEADSGGEIKLGKSRKK